MTMRSTGINLRHLGLLSRNAVRTSLRSGNGIVFILLCLFFGLMTSGLILVPVEYGSRIAAAQGVAMTQPEMIAQVLEQTQLALEVILGRNSDTTVWVRHLLYERPAILSAIFVAFAFGLPFIVVSGAFNQLSGDIQSRGLRFLLLRTERGNVYFARFAGYAFLSIATWGLLILTILLYFGLKVRLYDWAPMMMWSLQAFLAFAVLSLPYTAMCTWISAINSSPFGALTVGSIVVIVVPTVPYYLARFWEPLENLKYLVPWWSHVRLFHPDPVQVGSAVAANIVYTVVYLAIGFVFFSRRDL